MIIVNCIVEWLNYESALSLNPFQPSVAFHIETSYFFCSAKQLTSFFMKCNTGLQWVNVNWATAGGSHHCQSPILCEQDFKMRGI